MDMLNKPGWIEVVTGPMFAGKSEELIRRIRRLEYAKMHVLVFKPIVDNRYSIDEVVSHAKNHVKSIVISKSNEILRHIKMDTDAVVVDEVQFLDREIIDICDLLANRGVRVIVGGLDTDFRGEAFPIVAELMSKAEYVTKLSAICVKCGAPATKTQRIVDGVPASYDDPIVVVGANEQYEPRCRHCHQIVKTK